MLQSITHKIVYHSYTWNEAIQPVQNPAVAWDKLSGILCSGHPLEHRLHQIASLSKNPHQRS